MQIVNLPEEFIVRAKNYLGYERAVQEVIKALTREIVKNQIEVSKLWSDVEGEAKNLGIVLGKNEMFIYDQASEKFLVTTRT